LIAGNLGCDPRHENKVLVSILFLIGRFHFDHLCKWNVTHDVTLCMITMFMNKWRFTFCKYNCFPFHCVYLMQGIHHILLHICKYLMMQSSIWQMVHTRTSEDPILDIPKGSVRCGCGQVPRGGAPPPPPHPSVSLEQLLATQNDLMRRHQERDSLHSDFLATHLPENPTPWRRTTGFAPRSPSLGYFTV
jgi:hypothetical protein